MRAGISLIQPGQSVAQKFISVSLPFRCSEVISVPSMVIIFRFFMGLVWRLINKMTPTNRIKKIDKILLFFNLDDKRVLKINYS